MTQIRINLPPYFIKFGKENHINELRNNGIVYFNSLSYFKNIENDEVRRDALEGAISIEQLNEVQLYSDGKLIAHQKPGSKAQLYFHDKENNGNVYSLYAMQEGKQTSQNFLFDNRLLSFGDKLLLITNTKLFIERIIRQLKRGRMKFDLGYVKYYDKNTYSGILDPFNKPDVFSYQYEFRVYIETNDISPIKLEIGSIKNISKFFDSTMIQKMKLVSARTLSKAQLSEIRRDLQQKG